MLILLVTLQAVQVVILWTHDWVPLGRLNDVAAIRRHDSLGRLIWVTLLQSVPFTVLLFYSIQFLQTGYSHSLRTWLWIGYGVLFLGELRAWWIPYLLRAEPDRALRYREMFGGTYSFLPERNGLTPNALHCILHVTTLATVIELLMLTI
ncbi:MAG TPA: hypothetical protein VM711_03790 [Sphingomicrobium sp.]|nr:hypothetical protein [Sphingomicrobium sp.]